MVRVVLFLIMIGLGGCAAFKLPELVAPQDWQLGGGGRDGVVPDSGWWERLEDKKLVELIPVSLKNNPDVMIAKARVKEAQALRLGAQSSLWPRADVFVGGREERNDGDGIERLGGVEAAWEVDLFGVNRARAKAARADLRAARAAEDLARVSLVAAVVRTYGALWAQRVVVLSAQEEALAAAELQRIADSRSRAGLALPRELAEAQMLAAAAQADLAIVRQDYMELARALAVLSGEPVERIVALLPLAGGVEGQLIKPVEQAVIAGTPLEVLSQRPEVKMARANLEARLADTAAARALRWPNVSLGAVVGLGGWSRTVDTVGANVGLALLDFGAIRANIRANDARAEAALAEYRGAVQGALAEAEVRLRQLDDAERELSERTLAWQESVKIVSDAQARRRVGLDTPSTLPRAQQQMAGRRAAWAQAQSNYLAAYANVFTALAGVVVVE